MAAEDPLSDTSDEEPQPLTAAQKAKITRARNQAKEQADGEALIASTSKSSRGEAAGRKVSHITIASAVWDSRKRPDPPSDSERPSALVAPPRKSKKAKGHRQEDDSDVMDVDKVPAASVRKTKSNTKAASESESKGKNQTKSATVGPKRMYIPTINPDSDEDIASEILEKPHKPALKTSAAAASGPQVSIKPKNKSKKTVTSDEEKESSAKSQSDDDKDSDGSMSGDDADEGSLDLQAERPVIISHDDLLDFSDGHLPPALSRRSSSIRSMGGPPDTDFDYDHGDDHGDDAKTSSGVDDLDEEDWEEPKPVMQKKTKKKTAQQLKYEQEQPVVRSSKVIHDKAGSTKLEVSPESDWHQSARIVFPATGGAIKLLDQKPLLKGVLKDSMTLTLHDLAFLDFFPYMVSRESYASRTLRRVAREDEKTFQIQYRAKKDPKFCQRLGPLLFTRAGNVRTGLRNLSISTAATHYELNKTGLTASQIRSIVKQLTTDQQYIFPFAAVPMEKALVTSHDASESAVTFVTADGTVTKPAKAAALKVLKSIDFRLLTNRLKAFATDRPFQAPLIVDLIRETWWKGPKALGFKYMKELKSHRVDRPTEVVLPDPMACAAGAYAWAYLSTWQTGHYVSTPEFSQGLLEGAYKALEDFIKQQREGKSSKSFNKAMHDLYLLVSRSPSVPVTVSGSANNVITLAIDSD